MNIRQPSRKEIMKASHQITGAMRKLGLLEYPSDSICLTCGDKRKLVAHHWNGNEDATNIWFVCYRCNHILPNGGLSLEQARNLCDYGKPHVNLSMSVFLTFAELYFEDGDEWLDDVMEQYAVLTEWERANIACSGRLDSSRLNELLAVCATLQAKSSGATRPPQVTQAVRRTLAHRERK